MRICLDKNTEAINVCSLQVGLTKKFIRISFISSRTVDLEKELKLWNDSPGLKREVC